MSNGLQPRSALGVAFAVAALSCQFPTLYRELGTPPIKSVRLPGRTLAIAPTTLPDDLELEERVGLTLDSAIAEAFSGLGYEVVPAEVYGAIWDSLTLEAGGFFDPFTGQRNQEAYDDAVTVLFAALKERFAPDAVVYSGLWVTEAETREGFASWDGYREYFDLRAASGSVVLGLSLLVSVEGLTGDVAFDGEAGVRLIERYSSSEGVTMIESVGARLTPEVLVNAVTRVMRSLLPADSMVMDSTAVW